MEENRILYLRRKIMSTKDSQSQPWYKGDLFFAAGLAFLKLLFHLPFLGRYGYHHDELYFIACGEHFSFGYVDHPPLVPWLAKLSTALFGQSIFGLRIFSAIAGAAAIFLVVMLVRRLGGGRFAQLIAAVAMFIAPVYLRTGNLLCLPAFEPLFWVSCIYLLVRIIQEDRPKLFLLVGLVAGLGLLNKHSMLFFGFGLAVGLLFTPLRKYYKSPWLYGGLGIVFLLFLPNLIWQLTHGWPTLSFLLNLNSKVMSGITPIQFLAGQLLYIHPLNAVLWIWGLVFFFNKEGRDYRILGWIWLAVFVVLLLTKSKIYYLAPAYPPLLAGGAIALERWVNKRNWKKLKVLPISILLLGGLAMGPVSVPALSIDATEAYIETVTFGAFKNIYELTGDLRGMFGWLERVEAVARVYKGLVPEVRRNTIILAPNYGNAGAIDYLGNPYGLPDAYCLHMTYWLWGPPDHEFDTVIGFGFKPETMKKFFEEVEVAEELELKNVNPWVNPFRITICRQPKIPLSRIWERNRPW